MATNRWQSGQQKTAQVTEAQVTGFDVTTTYALSIGIKDVSVLGITDEAGTVAALVAAWNASTEPEFSGITAAVKSGATDTIELTADEAGITFVVASSVADGTGTIGATSTTTANTSPHDYNDDENWSTGSKPGADDVIIDSYDEDYSIKYGLDQNAVSPTSFRVKASFTGHIGLPKINEDGSSSYVEYLPDYLITDCDTIIIGEGEGSGSDRIKIDTDTNACTVDVYRTGSGIDGVPAFLWKGVEATNVLNVSSGFVGVAYYEGEAGQIATLRLSGNGRVICGPGVALGTLNVSDGELSVSSNVTTINMDEGLLTVNRAATVGTLNLRGGEVQYLSSGTITTLVIGPNGVFDASNDLRARTITNCTMHPGATLRDPFGTITFSNGIILTAGARLEDVTLDVGTGRTITPS